MNLETFFQRVLEIGLVVETIGIALIDYATDRLAEIQVTDEELEAIEDYVNWGHG